jgi:membrane dipeptidase
MHAAFLAIQGGNALSDPESARVFPLDRLLLTTLVHLTNNDLGDTSSPMNIRQHRGLLPRGRELIFELEAKRVWVDLAHASKKTFWDAVNAHERSRPLIVSHTAFSSLSPHWRNLDDDQARAITDSGGLIGILYHTPFLGESSFGGSVAAIASHIAYGVRRFGAEHICLGSDWDGMITPPIDMPTCLELPRLVQALFHEGLSPIIIRQVLGGSFLRLLKATHA